MTISVLCNLYLHGGLSSIKHHRTSRDVTLPRSSLSRCSLTTENVADELGKISSGLCLGSWLAGGPLTRSLVVTLANDDSHQPGSRRFYKTCARDARIRRGSPPCRRSDKKSKSPLSCATLSSFVQFLMIPVLDGINFLRYLIEKFSNVREIMIIVSRSITWPPTSYSRTFYSLFSGKRIDRYDRKDFIDHKEANNSLNLAGYTFFYKRINCSG